MARGRDTRRVKRLLAVLAGAVFVACGGQEADDETIRLAQDAYTRAKARGLDLSHGPCLGVIKPGWVADVAHDPRQAIDDEPENQCRAFREGEAEHFVELDPEGRYIRSG
jgi:hypothetical protein